MQDSIVSVEPSRPIHNALRLAQEQHADMVSVSVGDNDEHLAHCDDLNKMATMGLEALPVESIAIPPDSPLMRTERAQLAASIDYSRRLSAFFPVYFVAALYELQSLIQRLGLKAFVIGGITRDLLLFQEKRLSVSDVDITVEGDALAVVDFLIENSRNFQLDGKFPEFGTAKLRYKDTLMFDVASTRQEVYPHCGALPVVVNRGVPLPNDIIRRDFTVNALAFSIHELGQVLDYSNGIRDIQAREIRVLHPVSFFEDPSRILRALKFCARFDFNLANETHLLLERFLRFGGSSYKGGGERIKQELKGLLRIEEATAKSYWLRFFMETGCYRLLNMETAYEPSQEAVDRLSHLGELLPVVEGMLSRYLDDDFRFDVYLCFLLRDFDPDEFQKTSARLGLTRNEREFVEQFRRLKSEAKERFGALNEYSSPADIYDLFNGLHLITVVACILELGLDDTGCMKHVLQAFMTYKRKWENFSLELDGRDLMSLGVPKGKLIGQLLNELLHAKLIGNVAERLDEVQFIQNRLSTMPEINALAENDADTAINSPQTEATTDAAP